MFIKKTICDICGKDLGDSHPTKVQISEWHSPIGYDRNDRARYVVKRTAHICDRCKGKMDNFFIKEEQA